MTDTILEEDVRQAPSEPGDHDKFSHYFDKNDMMTSMYDGVPVKALCGIVIVVTRDGEKFPVCPECKEIWENLEED